MRIQIRHLLVAAVILTLAVYLLPASSAKHKVAKSTATDLSSNYAALQPIGLAANADLSITKSDSPDPVNTGSDLTYTITVNNSGPSFASNVSWTDTLPAGTTFNTLSVPGGWSCTTPAQGDTGTVTCSIPSFASGGGDTFTLDVVVNQSVPAGSKISNTATVTSSTTDPNPSNNSSTETTTVLSPSSIKARKSVSGGNTAGSTVTYIVVLSNSSGSDQQDNPGNEFTDVLPSGLTLVSADASSGIASANTGTNTVTWNGVIPAQDSVTIVITATINSGTEGQTITNQGTASYDADGNGTNESTTLTDDPTVPGSSDPTSFTVCFSSLVVTTNADSGAGSLRQIIADACPGASITFNMTQVTSPITLTSGEILIDKNLTIKGPTNQSLIISGNNNSRIFDINSSGALTISNLTFANGSSNFGGAIYSVGNLTITNSLFTDNHAVGGEGGAIDSEGGTLTIINSTISGNTADTDGGGLLNCGSSTARLTNVTITNNRADADGDSNGDGGGIGQVSSSDFTLNNTIVAGNFKGASPGTTPNDFFVLVIDPLSPHSFIDPGSSNNLIGVDTGLSTDISNGTSGNKIGTAGSPINPRLSPLADNGGPTKTHYLLPDSPALNAGNNDLAQDQNGTLLTTDQRGTGFPRVINSIVDIGALEANYALALMAGNNQSTPIKTQFATQLKVQVRVEGNPAGSGINVTFTAPGAGASGTFQGTGTNTATVATDSNGVATAPIFTANGTPGSYSVTATLPSGLPSATFNLTNTKGNQSITVNTHAPSSATYNTSFTVAATASSGLPVIYTSSGSCTNSGATFTMTSGTGTCSVIYNQPGDSNFNPAPQVTETVNAQKASQTITFGALSNKTFGDADFAVSATASSGLSVSFAASGQCTVNGSTVHITGAGSCTITASQSGNSNFNAATSVQQSFQIAKANQTITFGALADKTFGDADFTVSASSSSGLSVSFAATGNCTIAGNKVHLTGAGSCTITASQAGDSNYNAAADVPRTFQIAKANQTITFNPLGNKTYGDAPFTVSATASSGLSVSFSSQTTSVCTMSGNTVTIIAPGTCTIRASQSGDNNFNAATNVDQSFTVNKAASTTTVTSSANPSDFGQSVTFTATVKGPANTVAPTGTVQFKDNGTNLGSAVTLSNGVATLTTSTLAAGSHTITADYSGDSNFLTSTGTLLGGQSVNPSLSINDVSVTEVGSGTTNAVFTVTLAAASNLTVTVQFATADGTAKAGTDYQSTSGTLSFSPGETGKTITVPVIGHTLNGTSVNFFVNLSNPTNATISRSQGVGTIQSQQNTIQFSSGSYSVAESGLHATITVNRVGDISKAATVDYATTDPSGLNPCGQATGMASQRCDYAISVGTLRFAAGESSKTIFIPIVNDVWVEGPETFTIALSNPTGLSLGTIASATVTILDDDNGAQLNPISDDAFFVRQLYIDFLDREPDPAGLQGWLDILHNTSGQCKIPTDCDRIAVALGFVRSPEFQDRGYFIFRFYSTALGRNPGYFEFMSDMARVSGFLNSSELEANKSAFVDQFMSRQEFKSLYDSTLNNPTGYVDKLLNTVGLPNHPTRSTWIVGLTSGTLSRAQVLRQLVESVEVYSKYYNQALVVMQYFGFLRRDPDAAYQGWIEIFNHSSDYRILVNGFINSPEYPLRFGP